MKKITVFALITAVILILGGFSLSFSDELENITTEKIADNSASYYFIKHDFSKGSDLTMNICVDKEELNEEMIKLCITIQQESESDYKLSRINAHLNADIETEFIESFVSCGKGQYSIPITNISETSRKQILNGEDYVYYTAIVRKSELSEGLTLDISYDIKGVNLYCTKSFTGIKNTVQI